MDVLSRFEKLRKAIINDETIYNLLHLGPRTFEEIGGEVVQSVAFVFRNVSTKLYKGKFCRLTECSDPYEKEWMF